MRNWEEYVRQHLRLPDLAPEREARIVRELAGQLEDFYREALARGLNEAEADHHARSQIRDWTVFASRVREADRPHAKTYLERLEDRMATTAAEKNSRWNLASDLVQDMRYALRQLRNNPGFTFVAVMTLALGIGATTAIFSLVHAVLLRPLPFPEPDRLVGLRMEIETEPNSFRGVSFPDFRDWQQQTQSWESMAAVFANNFALVGKDEPEQVLGEAVTADYFTTLGVRPPQGRTFLPGETEMPPGEPAVVLSHGLWQRRYGGDPSILQRSVTIDGRAFTVVGIMPPGFEGVAGGAELWVPLSQISSRFARYLNIRGARWLSVFGRLKPGVSVEQAGAELQTLVKTLKEQHPRSNNRYGINLRLVSEILVVNFEQSLWVLFAAVAGMLLIVTANVANLSLARASGRQREVALRIALGASRGRLIRQLVAESLMLSLLGGLLGITLARWLVTLIPATVQESLPTYMVVSLDYAVLGFSLAVAAVTGVAFGIVPALHLSRVDPQGALKEGGRGAALGSPKQYLRSALVAAELGLAVVLLVVTGLLVQSLQRLLTEDPGFQHEHVLTAQVDLPDHSYGEAETLLFARRLQEELQAVPGIEHASLGSDVPLSGAAAGTFLFFEGRPEDVDNAPQVWRHEVTTDYLATFRIKLQRGRTFTEHDSKKSEPVALVSQQAADRFWPGQDPIGQRFRYMRNDVPAPWMTVVGVVGNAKFRSLTGRFNNEPDIYVPLPQAPVTLRNFFIAVRSAGDPASLTRPVQAAVHKIDPTLPVHSFRTLTERLDRTVQLERLMASLLGFFSGTALVLAVIGIYGVTSYAVGQRTQEIGLRMALGAGRGHIQGMVLSQGLKLTLAGVVIGVLVALAATRLLGTLLYGVQPTDPMTYVGVILLLAAVAALAAYLPAARAARVDPLVALRHE